MSIPCKSERGLLSHEELETVRVTHHPAIYHLAGEELQALKVRLREQQRKSRTLARQKQREMRGKADARGKSFPGTAQQPLRRKQIFAAAVKRVNKELDRQHKLNARATHVEAARRALALHRSAKFVHHPAGDHTAHEGMNPRPSTRRRTKVPGGKIGSISQATKIAQAIRDTKRRTGSGQTR